MKKEYWIGLGSNFESHKNISYAQSELKAMLGDIRFSSILITQPINCPTPYLFSNQVARGFTNLSKEDLIVCLKGIEQDCGRVAFDKIQGVIKLDLDLLIYDKYILKPKDIEFPYIQKGMAELK